MEINPLTVPTEWDELQAKYGNGPDPWAIYDLGKALTAQYRTRDAEEIAEEKHATLDSKSLSDLSDMEDSEDEDILAQYREKRIAEIKAKQQRAKFGELTEIRANEFIDQVSNVKDHFVFCFLYQEYIPVCKRVLIYLSALARKFKDVKFVKIVGSECIPGYPDHNIPTVLIYHNGEKKHFVIGTSLYGGNNCTEADIEYWLGQLGIVDTDLEEDPRLKVQTQRVSRFKMTNRSAIINGTSSYSDDSD
ncbi:hypothetical protein RCL1_007036 [Eukaryota sp. TZLM3-RCL]